ncbi:MAG TPA: hypothetical protein PK191_10365 [Niabella sp.]|nr:hypothetical protein [Niabella sp.]HOZ97290.1 hypothetical protein [Niabella sp.]HQW15439.1 hypothetical protein [Niabella sp.]HQX20515.1 hypothetical protein [Niabella sp.]HQX41726.1 hypothetical protein [Niabella sp.]
MKILNIAFALFALAIVSCGEEKKETVAQPFCSDTSCVSEPILVKGVGAGNPFVRISFKDCEIDSIHWEKGGMGTIKDIIFKEFVEKPVRPSKPIIACEIYNGKHAWVKFNDCATGRGYLLKLPFEANGTTSKYTSAINNFDPKFKIEDGLIAYYDNTFIYVENAATGEVAKQLMTDSGVTGIDYDNVHSLIDSVNISKGSIYAKLTVDGKEVIHNNPLTFK